MSMKGLLLILALSLATIATGGACGFEIDKDIIIWSEGTPVEQAIEDLKGHVVEAIRRNPSTLTSHDITLSRGNALRLFAEVYSH